MIASPAVYVVLTFDEMPRIGMWPYWLETSGWFPTAPVPRVSLGLDRGLRNTLGIATIVFALLGPFVLAVATAVGRPRWWWGPLVGIAVGSVLALVGAAAGYPQCGAVVQLYWLVAGLLGGLLAAVRRRYGC